MTPGKTTPHKTVANGPFFKLNSRLKNGRVIWSVCPFYTTYYKQKHGVFGPSTHFTPHYAQKNGVFAYNMWGEMGGRTKYPMFLLIICGVKWADGPNTPRPSIYSIKMVRLRRFCVGWFSPAPINSTFKAVTSNNGSLREGVLALPQAPPLGQSRPAKKVCF